MAMIQSPTTADAREDAELSASLPALVGTRCRASLNSPFLMKIMGRGAMRPDQDQA